MIWTNKYCFSDTWQGADVACEAEIKGLCVCVCVQTPEIMWKAGAFPHHQPFSEVAADHFSLCFVVKLSGFHNQVSQSRMQRPYDARAPLFAAFRPHHTDTVRTGCTLWKRLCFIEIQQTSTGCFAGLGDRNRARMLFKQRKKKNIHGSYFLLTRRTPETPPAHEPSWVRTSSRLGREGKRLCGVEDETKTSWCSKSVWVQRCWYVKLKIERASSAGGFESVQACFCAQGCC